MFMQQLKEAKDEGVDRANERSVSYKSLEKNMDGKKWTESLAFQKTRRQNIQLVKAEDESDLLTMTSELLLVKKTKTTKPSVKKVNKRAERVDPNSVGVAIGLEHKFPCQACDDVVRSMSG